MSITTVSSSTISDFECETVLALALSQQASSRVQKRAADTSDDAPPAKKRKADENISRVFHKHIEREIPESLKPVADEIAKIDAQGETALLIPDLWSLVLDYAEPTLGDAIIEKIERQYPPRHSLPIHKQKVLDQIIGIVKKIVKSREFKADPVAFAKKIKPTTTNPVPTCLIFDENGGGMQLEIRSWIVRDVEKFTGQKIPDPEFTSYLIFHKKGALISDDVHSHNNIYLDIHPEDDT